MHDLRFDTVLKRFLIDLPTFHDYQLTEEAKKDIRRALFVSLSNNGQCLEWLFPQLFSCNTDREVAIETLENDLNWLYSEYYSNVSKSRDPTHNTHNHHAFHSNSPCARIFRRGEPIFKCLTCGFDETCALCSHCYQPENHKDHAVHITICQRENGGVCDCGDPEAWVSPFLCKYALEDGSYTNFSSREVSEELQYSFFRTIEIFLDYVIDVMSQADLQFYSPWEVATNPEKYSANCNLDPKKYGYETLNDSNYDKPSEKYSLIAYNDQVRHFRDAVQRIHLASKKVPEFATMVAEKVQNHGRATVIRSRDVSLLFDRQKILSATGLASCIRNARDEFREDMCHEMILWLGSLTESEVFKSNDTLKNLFCRAFCCRWDKGLLTNLSNHQGEYCRGKLDSYFLIPKVDCCTNLSLQKQHWSFTPSLWNLPQQICEDCNYNLSLDDYQLDSGHLGSRFQYMVYLDIRFWKSIRMFLHDMYATSLITNLTFKGIISCQYVDIYPTIADMFLTLDGEPEVNIMCTLSTQLFTCPSNSTSIIAHGDVSRIFSSIYNFLKTGQIKSSSSLPLDDNKILMSSLKNRRWGQIFFDIGYILNRGKDRELILTNSIIPMACDILSLFQGRPVMKRERESHVEYESSDYTAFFHAIPVIFQFAEYIAHSVTNLDPAEREKISHNAISCVTNYLLQLEVWDHEGILTDYNDVDYGQRSIDVDSGDQDFKVSLLHPIHSFLSWLIEFSNFDSLEKMLSIFKDSYHTYCLANRVSEVADYDFSRIFEYPVRTVVLSSQIKSGFWVRNGFSVRSQLQLYKNTGLREQGYMRDLFLIQVFMISSDYNTVSELFLKRWLLSEGWITNTDNSKVAYDLNILPYILEECLSFFIHVLTEDVFLRHLSSEETTHLRVKNEIIHNLCFGPMSFSRLSSQIPEHISSEKRFDMILEELTNFKKPKTSKDTGTYSLKEQYLDEIDPYYFNYSANKKDDAIKFVKDRVTKSTTNHFHEAVIKPKRRNATELGIYRHLGNFTTSRSFVEFLIRTLKFIFDEGVHKMDGLLETTLHLIHICSMEEMIDTELCGTFFARFCDISQTFQTSLAIQLYHIISIDDFKAHHSKIREIFKVLDKKHHTLVKILSGTCNDFNPSKLELVTEEGVCENELERKKRVAKERQAKLMAKFKKQQSLFIKKNNFCTDCSDTEMEELEEEGWKFPDPHCILCQDTAQDAGPFGIITFISKSSEFRDVPFDDPYWFLKSFSDHSNLNETENEHYVPEHHSEKWEHYMKKIDEDYVIGPGFSNQRLVHNKLVSLTCGHGMHFNCYMQFLYSSRTRLSQITRNTPDSIEHREFLCPLCKAINNMFIPILWSSNDRSLERFITPSTVPNIFDGLLSQKVHENEWLKEFCRTASADLEQISILTPSAKEMINSESTASTIQFRTLLSNMFHILSSLTFPQIFKADSPDILINSIKSTEISLRGVGSHSALLVDQISNNTLINLRALNEFRITSLLMKISNWLQLPSNRPDAHVKILANLFALSSDSFNSSILNLDFFSLLVNIFPLPSTGFSFNAILSACFTGSIIQNLYLISTEIVSHKFYLEEDYNILDIPFSEMITEADAQRALALFKKFVLPAHDISVYAGIVSDPKFGYVLFSMLMKSINPFLRQSAIYAYVCCSNMEGVRLGQSLDQVFESDALCQFLNLPTLSESLCRLCSTSSKEELPFEAKKLSSFLMYIKRSAAKVSKEDHDIRKTIEYPGIVRLAKLPERLDNFFTRYYYLDKYNNPNLSIENPAICLFCCEVVDVQKGAIGSDFGQCTTHYLKECSNSVGIFLLPKERCLYLIHKNGGSFHDEPYLDQHGEIPGENKKGKTVYLLKERYDDFTRNVWLQHNVPNYIVRKLDSVIDAGGWETL